MKNISIVVGVLIIVGGVVFLVQRDLNKGNESNSTPARTETVNNDRDDVVDNTPQLTNMPMDGGVGVFTTYDESLLSSGRNVIFFHASWCPTCRGLERNIEAELDQIPGDLIILKADYDDQKELRKKYDVTIQHTLVQVDENGELIKKWSGGNDIDDILAEL